MSCCHNNHPFTPSQHLLIVFLSRIFRSKGYSSNWGVLDNNLCRCIFTTLVSMRVEYSRSSYLNIPCAELMKWRWRCFLRRYHVASKCISSGCISYAKQKSDFRITCLCNWLCVQYRLLRYWPTDAHLLTRLLHCLKLNVTWWCRWKSIPKTNWWRWT